MRRMTCNDLSEFDNDLDFSENKRQGGCCHDFVHGFVNLGQTYDCPVVID